MTGTDPYASPREHEATTGPTATAVAWALAGAVGGTALGSLLDLLSVTEGAVALGLSGAGAAGVAGLLAWAFERHRARRRPTVLDGHGRLSRPLGAWLLLLPLVCGVGGLLALVVLGTVHTGRPAVGVAFLVAALGFATLARPLWTGRLLVGALQDAESGRLAAAEATWRRLATSRFAPRGAAAQAALNLGWLALRRGDLDEAAGWYALPDRGRAAAFAASGLALVHVLRGDWEQAEHLVGRTGGRAVQAELDGVRLLLVLRRDGAAEARELGERLLDDGAAPLFLGVLAAARRRTGDPAGADAILAGGAREALADLSTAVPELRER